MHFGKIPPVVVNVAFATRCAAQLAQRVFYQERRGSVPQALQMISLVAVAAIVTLAVGPVMKWLQVASEQHAGKRALYPEIHSLLEVTVKQNAAIIEIRDLLRVRPILDTNNVVAAINALHQGILEQSPTGQIVEITKAIDDAGRDIVEKIHSIGTLIAAFKQQFDGQDRASSFMEMRSHMEVSVGKLAQILGQLEKNDQRLFEFVNSTKRIMRAMEGQTGEDEDALIEEAKMIRARAAERGIEITLEDALKRAREHGVFRG